MPWYQNPTISAILGSLVGVIITSLVSLYIWKKTHKLKRIDCVIYNKASILQLTKLIEKKIEIKVANELANSIYLFNLEFFNSGTSSVANQPFHLRFDKKTKIVAYNLKTKPELGFGNIEENINTPNSLDLHVELMNPADSIELEIITVNNESEMLEIGMKNADVVTREYDRNSAKNEVIKNFSSIGTASLAALGVIPFLGNFSRSLLTIHLANKIDKISDVRKND